MIPEDVLERDEVSQRTSRLVAKERDQLSQKFLGYLGNHLVTSKGKEAPSRPLNCAWRANAYTGVLTTILVVEHRRVCSPPSGKDPSADESENLIGHFVHEASYLDARQA